MNYEVGGEFNHEFKDFGTTSLGATAFFNDINNAIGSYRVDSSLCSVPSGTAPNQYCFQYQNVDRGYSMGAKSLQNKAFGVINSYLGRIGVIYKEKLITEIVTEIAPIPLNLPLTRAKT